MISSAYCAICSGGWELYNEPVSFTSTENTDIGLVQFAIRTSDIKIAEEEEVETEAPKETILDKMKNLF